MASRASVEVSGSELKSEIQFSNNEVSLCLLLQRRRAQLIDQQAHLLQRLASQLAQTIHVIEGRLLVARGDGRAHVLGGDEAARDRWQGRSSYRHSRCDGSSAGGPLCRWGKPP